MDENWAFDEGQEGKTAKIESRESSKSAREDEERLSNRSCPSHTKTDDIVEVIWQQDCHKSPCGRRKSCHLIVSRY